MTKTLDDYMNDPEIAHEPMALREIHAIRLQIYDETKDMTDAEYNSLVHREAMAFLHRAEERKKTKSAPAELGSASRKAQGPERPAFSQWEEG